MDAYKFREQILDWITDDNYHEKLFEVIFYNDNYIDKQALFALITNIVKEKGNASMQKNTAEFINSIQDSSFLYDVFIKYLKDKLTQQLQNTKEYGKMVDVSFNSLYPDTFWPFFSIAIKKCINSPKEVIDNTDMYFNLIPNLNQYQKEVHNECLIAFNCNANDFNRKKNPELKIFLHSFGSKNKKIKTRKKNLQRVKRRAKKVMQVYKLSHNETHRNIFSNGRHKVPDQFSDCIINIFLNTKTMKGVKNV